jgi:hypothetical protein
MIYTSYLNKVELELLSLVNYHRKQYEQAKMRQGGLHPDDIEIMKILNSAEELLRNIAAQRKETEDVKLQPVVTLCPNCNVVKERKPVGEKKDKDGYLCNQYHCDKCNKVYTDDSPNNGKDQLKVIEATLAFVEKNKAKYENVSDDIKKDILELNVRAAQFRIACRKEDEALEKLKKAERELDKSLSAWSDYLLVAKLKGWSSNTPMGES